MKDIRTKGALLLSALFFISVSLIFSCSDDAAPVPVDLTPADQDPADQDPADTASPLVIETTHGKIKGKAIGDRAYAWLGIPYAEPPVGDLRWKAPRNSGNWEELLETDAFASICTQESGISSGTDPATYGEPIGSEDCLYLNIWRPQTDKTDLPVFFWIHGGANTSGSGSVILYEGTNFAVTQDFVVVTINYRLGPFGWFYHDKLATGPDVRDMSGNYGTLDIFKALEWVQENIAAFGGDPGNVTIAGESAGGWNVQSLMVSPLSKNIDLFHRAISQSGATGTISRKDAHDNAHDVLLNLLLKDGSISAISEADDYIRGQEAVNPNWAADYLRGLAPDDIIAYDSQLSAEKKGILRSAFAELGADAADEESDEALLSLGSFGKVIHDGFVILRDPWEDLFFEGNYKKVPLLIGSNSEEAKFFMIFVFTTLSPDEFSGMIDAFDPDNPAINAEDIVENPAGYNLLAGIFNLFFGRQTLTDPIAKNAAMHHDVYAYEFRWDEEPSPFDELIGAGHAIEIPFVFGNFIPAGVLKVLWSEQNRPGREALSEAMMSYWANFARTGNPNMEDTGLPEWEPWPDKPLAKKRLLLDAGEIKMGF